MPRAFLKLYAHSGFDQIHRAEANEQRDMRPMVFTLPVPAMP